MVFDPLVDSALIGLAGVVVGIGGYAVQNWLIKKKDRERAEFVIKRKKYEQWLKVLLAPLYTKDEERVLALKTGAREFREVCNLILLYGSDEVVRALCDFWKVSKKPEGDTIVNAFRKLVIAMRKDLLVKTSLSDSDIEFLNWA